MYPDGPLLTMYWGDNNSQDDSSCTDIYLLASVILTVGSGKALVHCASELSAIRAVCRTWDSRLYIYMVGMDFFTRLTTFGMALHIGDKHTLLFGWRQPAALGSLRSNNIMGGADVSKLGAATGVKGRQWR